MAYIKIKLDAALMDGHNVTFKAPCDCTAIEGLKVCYIENNSLQEKIFSMKDTHGNALAGLGNLFAAGAYVHAILDSVNLIAYLQNAATNGYLEKKLSGVETAIAADHAAIEDLVNNQIPEEYLQACVDDYINEKGAGIATKEEVNALDNKLSGEIESVNSSLSSEIAENVEITNRKIDYYAFEKGYAFDNSNKSLFEQGYIVTSGSNKGSIGFAENAITTTDYINSIAELVTVENGTEIAIGKYNLNGTFVSRGNWGTSDFVVDNSYLYKISVRASDMSNIGVEYGVNIHLYKGKISTEYKSVYSGKSLSILGDSISTFDGYIPSENEPYYPISRCEDVTDVSNTWWWKLANALGMEICVNNSWSGSRVTTTDTSKKSAVERANSLHNGTKKPNTIIFAMGVNDFIYGVSLGEYDGSGDFPTTTDTFREAYATTLKTILETYTESEVLCATIMNCERISSVSFPEKNSRGETINEWNNAIREIADLFGVKVLEHSKCGITYQNLPLYMGDYDFPSDGQGLHPNNAGHSLIANNDIRQMDNFCRVRY